MKLVAYFSASGVTKETGHRLSIAANADEFEIIPEAIYTQSDLDWRNKQSRSSIEMNDASARPAISNKVENMDQYDTIYVGFPIWWYREPRIIDTFIEQYDFSGKTIILFATSGSSGFGQTKGYLQALAPEANIKEGKVYHSIPSASQLKCLV